MRRIELPGHRVIEDRGSEEEGEMEFLPGLKGMLNYHPVFVHFPIAFWVGALLFELLAMFRKSEEVHRTARRLLYAGTIFAVGAVWTGLYAQASVPEAGPAHEIVEIHERMMLLSTSLAVGLCMLAAFKREMSGLLRKLFLLGLVVLAALMGIGADRGAQLVYQYATGVDLSKEMRQPQRTPVP